MSHEKPFVPSSMRDIEMGQDYAMTRTGSLFFGDSAPVMGTGTAVEDRISQIHKKLSDSLNDSTRRISRASNLDINELDIEDDARPPAIFYPFGANGDQTRGHRNQTDSRNSSALSDLIDDYEADNEYDHLDEMEASRLSDIVPVVIAPKDIVKQTNRNEFGELTRNDPTVVSQPTAGDETLHKNTEPLTELPRDESTPQTVLLKPAESDRNIELLHNTSDPATGHDFSEVEVEEIDTNLELELNRKFAVLPDSPIEYDFGTEEVIMLPVDLEDSQIMSLEEEVFSICEVVEIEADGLETVQNLPKSIAANELDFQIVYVEPIPNQVMDNESETKFESLQGHSVIGKQEIAVPSDSKDTHQLAPNMDELQLEYVTERVIIEHPNYLEETVSDSKILNEIMSIPEPEFQVESVVSVLMQPQSLLEKEKDEDIPNLTGEDYESNDTRSSVLKDFKPALFAKGDQIDGYSNSDDGNMSTSSSTRMRNMMIASKSPGRFELFQEESSTDRDNFRATTSHVVRIRYYPQKPDEMLMHVGDIIGIETEFTDGWGN